MIRHIGLAPARAPRARGCTAACTRRRARRRGAAARRPRPLDVDRPRDGDARDGSVPLPGARRGRSLARALARRRHCSSARARPSCAWARARWPGRPPIRWPRASGTSPPSTRSRTADVLPVPAGDPVTVAVIDSGIDRTSPDLAGVVPLAPIDEAHDPTTSLVHGTAVAGIIAADAEQRHRRARRRRAVREAARLPRRRRRRRRSATSRPRRSSDAVGAGARVINLSLGGHRDPEAPRARRVLARGARRDLLRRQPRRRRGRGGRQLRLGHRRLRQLAGGAAPRDRRLGRRPEARLVDVLEHAIRSSTTSRPRATGIITTVPALAGAHGLVARRAARHDDRRPTAPCSARRSRRRT